MLLFNHALSEEGGKEKIFLFLSTITLISALRGWKLGSSLIPFRQRVYGSDSQRARRAEREQPLNESISSEPQKQTIGKKREPGSVHLITSENEK